jgi:hypothetical protein
MCCGGVCDPPVAPKTIFRLEGGRDALRELELEGVNMNSTTECVHTCPYDQRTSSNYENMAPLPYSVASAVRQSCIIKLRRRVEE